MKRIISLLLVTLITVGVMSLSAQNAPANKAKIDVDKAIHDFGKIKEADGVVQHVFEIKNIGDAPLVITRVISSCGCATPSYSREPIAPGKTGKVTVQFDPRGRIDPFLKTVSIYSNGKEGPFILTIKGEVE